MFKRLLKDDLLQLTIKIDNYVNENNQGVFRGSSYEDYLMIEDTLPDLSPQERELALQTVTLQGALQELMENLKGKQEDSHELE